jgi:hypothetical protein
MTEFFTLLRLPSSLHLYSSHYQVKDAVAASARKWRRIDAIGAAKTRKRLR